MIHYPKDRTKTVAGTAGAVRVVVGSYFGRPRSGPPLTAPKRKRRPQAAVQPSEPTEGTETPREAVSAPPEAPTATTAPVKPEPRWLISPSGSVCHIETGDGRTACGRVVAANWVKADGTVVKCSRCEEVAP